MSNHVIYNFKKFSKKQLYLILGIILLSFFYYVITNSGAKEVVTDSEYMFNKEGELLFLDSIDNLKFKIDIEIANNDEDRKNGLMYRYRMDEKNGMLFIFPTEEIQSFWMKNTYIPLDIVFVDSAKKIVTIHANTLVQSEQSYKSSLPAKYVIEVNGGFCSRYNISITDKIHFIPPFPK